MSTFNQLLNEYDEPGVSAGGTSGLVGSSLTLPTKTWLGDVDVSSPSPNALLENSTIGRTIGDYYGIARGGVLSYPGFAPESSSSLAQTGDTYVYVGPGSGDNGSSWTRIHVPVGTNAVGASNIAPGAVTSEKLAPQTTIIIQKNEETVDLTSDQVNAVMFGPKTDGSWRILATNGALLFQTFSEASASWVVSGAMVK
jgi:hypothetical protein